MLNPKEIPQLLEFGDDRDYGEDVFHAFLKGTPYLFVNLSKLRHGASLSCRAGKWEIVLISQRREPFVVVWRPPEGKWENVTCVLPFHH